MTSSAQTAEGQETSYEVMLIVKAAHSHRNGINACLKDTVKNVPGSEALSEISEVPPSSDITSRQTEKVK